MKLLKVFLLLFVVALSSCVDRDEFSTGNMREVVFHADWGPETRTTLQSDGQIFWSPNDSISLFCDENAGTPGGYRLTSNNKTAAATTDFVGSVPNGLASTTYYAVYPYNQNSSYSGDGQIYVRIPTVQIAKENSLPENAFYSVAKADGNNLYFKNICGGVQFTVASEGIQSVEFRAQSAYSSSLSGLGLVQFNADGIPEVNYINEPSYVVVKAPDGSSFAPGKNYYAVMLPFDDGLGLVVTYRKESTEASYVYNNFSVKRSSFKKVEAKDKDLTFKISQKKALLSNDMVPRSWDAIQYDITEIKFHANSDKVTEECVSIGGGDFYPIYREMEGTVCHLYTKAEKYEMDATFNLFALDKLKVLDLTNVSMQNRCDFGGFFSGCSNLTDIIWGDFNAENVTNLHGMFSGCSSLKHLDLSFFNTSKVTNMANMFFGCTNLESVNLSNFDTSNVEEMYSMFQDCENLTSLDLSNFNTSKVREMGSMFANCNSLRKLDISNFTSESLNGGLQAALYLCTNLTQLNMGNFDLSCGVDILNMCPQLANSSKNCGILCTPATKDALLDASNNTKLTKTAKYITWFTPGQTMPDFEPKIDPNLYYSSDYGKDKKVKKLQSATKGNGIDLVIMGDAYSDRLIADGTYDKDMKVAMEAIFAREPYKTYRNLFNVYEIYAVSENEVSGESTVFGYYDFGDRDGMYLGDTETITDYVKKATSRNQLRDDVGIVVISNNHDLGGVASGNFSYNENGVEDGCFIAFVNSDDQGIRFGRTVSHEFGHSFGHLLDEYWEYLGYPEDWEKNYFIDTYNMLGFYSNVDFTSDAKKIKWHRMLEDSRYAGSGIGVFEGGATYSNGVWRSTENSIMNDNINQDRFNAVCREAIYKRIHQLAYGNSWKYNYETFVKYDSPNIKEDKAALSSTRSIIAAPKKDRKPFFKYEVKEGPNGTKKVTIVMN